MADKKDPASEPVSDTTADDAREQAEFAGGFEADKPAEKRAATPATSAPAATPRAKEQPAAAPRAKGEPKPEFVQITRKDWEDVRAAAARTASYDSQFSKAFGTLGGLQKTLNDLQTATPRGGKIEIPKDAFAAMERDFPELAEHTRAALEATLRGFTGSGPANANIDPDVMRRLVSEHAEQVRTNAEIEALDDIHPDWRKIVGQVDISKQQPDPNNAFRKWLATKPIDYQTRINSANSAAVLSRAIDRFQSETKANGTPAAPSLKAQLQAARIRGAVQPRGDGGHAAESRNDDSDFLAGFASR